MVDSGNHPGPHRPVLQDVQGAGQFVELGVRRRVDAEPVLEHPADAQVRGRGLADQPDHLVESLDRHHDDSASGCGRHVVRWTGTPLRCGGAATRGRWAAVQPVRCVGGNPVTASGVRLGRRDRLFGGTRAVLRVGTSVDLRGAHPRRRRASGR